MIAKDNKDHLFLCVEPEFWISRWNYNSEKKHSDDMAANGENPYLYVSPYVPCEFTMSLNKLRLLAALT